VFVVNPSGIYFGQGTQVNVHGLLATTLDISNKDFLNSQYQFKQDHRRPLASIVNEGNLQGGKYVGLLAPRVENRGTIVVANLGSVALASGEAAVLDFNGDGLINFAISKGVSGTATDIKGNPVIGGVSNEGLIRTNGGQVVLRAQDAGNVIRNVVNHTGIIEANTVVQKEGKVLLSGGDKSSVYISGDVKALGDDSGERGGEIEITGENAALLGKASIDVSGSSGGGTIQLGNGPLVPKNGNTMKSILISPETTLMANANDLGDGGTIGLWAEEHLLNYGSISATGGATGGNGGKVRTSGKKSLILNKTPNVSAAQGNSGEWQIDSSEIEIVDGKKGILSSVNTLVNSSTGPKLDVHLVAAALCDGTNVMITTGYTGPEKGKGDITLNAKLDYLGPGNNTLTLAADNDVVINKDIVSTRGDALKIDLFSDTDHHKGGKVIVARGATVNTHGGVLHVMGSDLDLEGHLNSGKADTMITVAHKSGNMKLGKSSKGGFNLSGDELSRISAQNLVLNAMNNMMIEGIQSGHTGNIRGQVVLNSWNNTIFQGSKSTFRKLTINAEGNINVEADVETTHGDFTGNASLGSNSGNFNLQHDTTVTSGEDIIINAQKVNIQGTFRAAQDLIINGVIVNPGDPIPTKSPQMPKQEEGVSQGSLSTFLTEFFQNSAPGDC
jgi:hypothetical protein